MLGTAGVVTGRHGGVRKVVYAVRKQSSASRLCHQLDLKSPKKLKPAERLARCRRGRAELGLPGKLRWLENWQAPGERAARTGSRPTCSCENLASTWRAPGGRALQQPVESVPRRTLSRLPARLAPDGLRRISRSCCGSRELPTTNQPYPRSLHHNPFTTLL